MCLEIDSMGCSHNYGNGFVDNKYCNIPEAKYCSPDGQRKGKLTISKSKM